MKFYVNYSSYVYLEFPDCLIKTVSGKNFTKIRNGVLTSDGLT